MTPRHHDRLLFPILSLCALLLLQSCGKEPATQHMDQGECEASSCDETPDMSQTTDMRTEPDLSGEEADMSTTPPEDMRMEADSGSVSPEDAPTLEDLEAAADYSASVGGGSVLVMHRGEILFERYDNGSTEEDAFHIHSATKAFWAPVAAALIEDGLLEGYDMLATEVLPEWRDDPYKSQITLRHLMQLNAIQVQNVEELQGECGGRDTLADNLYTTAIQTPVRRTPGEHFSYGPVSYYVFGEIVRRVLAPQNLTPLQYLERRFFEPMGLTYDSWCFDKSGNPHIPNSARITAKQWVKWGQLILHRGAFGGEQLVSAALMEELYEPSEVNPGHGLFLWLNTPGGANYSGPTVVVQSDPSGAGGIFYRDGEPNMIVAAGAGKNRQYIFPERELIVLRQSNEDTQNFSDHKFLSFVFGTN